MKATYNNCWWEMDLSALHKKMIAVEIRVDPGVVMLKGAATFSMSAELGGILRIAVEDPPDTGTTAILIHENDFNGVIVSGEQYDCDHLVKVNPGNPEFN